MADLTYLELSEGASHKFYEVTVDGLALTIRYGRIGDPGQTSTTRLGTPAAARAEADKKIQEKKRKGYGDAVPGVRQKRPVTRRSIPGASARGGRSSSSDQLAPVLWRFDSGTSALGISIDHERCWVGNESGEVYSIDHAGKVHLKFQLPDGVKCIVRDQHSIYAGCDDGHVYDLSGKAPRQAYSIEDNVDIYWVDIHDGLLAVSDAHGMVATFNPEEEPVWSKQSAGDRAWMVRVDELAVFHGHSKGVTRYDRDTGKALWTRPTNGWIGFGWQEEGLVFASTANGTVHRFTKKGDVQTVYRCDGYLCSCATTPDGKYVFASGDDALYCFEESGRRLWKLATGIGSAQSMQFFEGKLYIVTHHGYLACVDASEEAIAKAQKGEVPKHREVKAGTLKAAAVATGLETTRTTGKGVVVECYEEKGKLRVRVTSPGYDASWHVQFPRASREKGTSYVVEQVLPSAKGGFYRALGDIRKLVK